MTGEIMIEKDIEYMKEALRMAEAASQAGEIPVGAVVVKNGEIIGRGQNRRESGGGASAHAEILAINEACAKLGGWRLTGCELYVTLEPCPMCMGAIINARIRNVYYGAADRKAGALGGLFDMNSFALNHHPNVVGGICEDECSALISGFFAELREKRKKEKEN